MRQHIVKNLLGLFLLILLSPEHTYSQGALLDHAAYDKLPCQPVYGDGSKAEQDVLKDLPKTPQGELISLTLKDGLVTFGPYAVGALKPLD